MRTATDLAMMERKLADIDAIPDDAHITGREFKMALRRLAHMECTNQDLIERLTSFLSHTTPPPMVLP